LSNFRRRRRILYTMTARDTETETEADLTLQAAQRASSRPPFMAWLLARFQEQQGCSDLRLAAQLGLPPDRLPRLALCLRPCPDHFTEDVAALATRFGHEPAALAAFVQRATAALAQSGRMNKGANAENMALTSAGGVNIARIT
jgi:hypothetical protein